MIRPKFPGDSVVRKARTRRGFVSIAMPDEKGADHRIRQMEMAWATSRYFKRRWIKPGNIAFCRQWNLRGREKEKENWRRKRERRVFKLKGPKRPYLSYGRYFALKLWTFKGPR